MLRALSFGPYLNKTHGMGNNVSDKKPQRLPAHEIVRLSQTIDRFELVVMIRTVQ